MQENVPGEVLHTITGSPGDQRDPCSWESVGLRPGGEGIRQPLGTIGAYMPQGFQEPFFFLGEWAESGPLLQSDARPTSR